MVIKLYISGISGNKEVKKKQQRVQMILDSKQINYEAIDITEPGKEKDKEFMQQNGKVRESLGKYPLPPQIFNDDDFCGDYEDFDLANEVDELEKFLHIETSSKPDENDSKQEKELQSSIGRKQHHINSISNPYEYHTFKIDFNSVNGLNEQIINTNDLPGENNETELVTKNEVNGKCETVPDVELSSENTNDNFETSPEEVVAPEKEGEPAKENNTNEESGEKESEENVDEKIGQGVEEEAGEKEEEEGVELTKEENPNEDKSPPPEEKEEEKEDVEVDEEKEEKVEVESEKGEEESDNESPQSEKDEEE